MAAEIVSLIAEYISIARDSVGRKRRDETTIWRNGNKERQFVTKPLINGATESRATGKTSWGKAKVCSGNGRNEAKSQRIVRAFSANSRDSKKTWEKESRADPKSPSSWWKAEKIAQNFMLRKESCSNYKEMSEKSWDTKSDERWSY